MANRARYDAAGRFRLMFGRAGARGTRIAAFALGVLVVVFGAVSRPEIVSARIDPNYGLVELQRAIDTGNRAYVSALVKRDPVAFGELFTPDAVSMPSTAGTIHGREAIVASIREVFAQMTFVRGSLRTLETHLEGESASEIGAYSFDVIVDGNARTLSGRYLVIWRDVGGMWKIAVDSSQPGAPAD